MVTADGADVQRPQKATLKRKLTGPPRLLLGKTATRTAEDKPETTMSDDVGINSTDSTNEPTESTDVVLSAVEVETTRGTNRRRWWRRFSPVVVCYRKSRKHLESLETPEGDGGVPPKGAPREKEDTTEGKGARGKWALMARGWPKFKRRPTKPDGTSEVKDGEESPKTFRKRMRKFFSRRGRSRFLSVPLVDVEGVATCEEAESSPTGLPPDWSPDGSGEAVTVAADVSVRPHESPDGTTAEPQPVHAAAAAEDDSADDAITSDMIRIEVAEDLDLPVPELLAVSPPVNDGAQLLIATAPPPPDVKASDGTTSRCLLPSANGPFIRIELVPPDDVTQEEEEEPWEGSLASETHNHLLLVGAEVSERQLLQTARSLVRAAMNAAVAQLTREQQSGSDCVHREPPGCRDHA
ncbi:uncharacterized protein si:dkey-1h6.8 [Antennarius striatus]|uniref:uncharacterized protein si:dkey-1h6.8 n=1 Tax=Antennarius striatus TaxID=241820 RepID=UPI0035AE0C68